MKTKTIWIVFSLVMLAGCNYLAPVNGISLNKTDITIAVGATEQVTPTVTPLNALNRMVNWTTSDAAIATVSTSGVILAVSTGTATITATTMESAFSAVCKVTVIPADGSDTAVTGVSLDRTAVTMGVGGTEQLTASVVPSTATNKSLSWTTSNAAIATVSASGLVTAVSLGTATITAKTADGGFTATCAVTVAAVQQVSGHRLTGNETWSGQIILKGDIEIPAGITLTIQPGTTIRAVTTGPDWDGGNYADLVDIDSAGTLIANGTQTSLITFTSNDSSPEINDWGGIGLTGGTASLTYCRIEYSYYGLFIYSLITNTPSVNNCLFIGTGGMIDFGPSHNFSNLSFVNGEYGYERFGSMQYATISNCVFSGNSMIDIQVAGDSCSISVSSSNFSNNKWNNLYISSSVTNSSITATNCYGIATKTGNGNIITVSNPAAGPIAGAGCGFTIPSQGSNYGLLPSFSRTPSGRHPSPRDMLEREREILELDRKKRTER